MKIKTIMTKYKVDQATAEDLHRRKNGRCECCGLGSRFMTRSNIDHCHTTGKVRGILCTSCNVIIGQHETGYNTEIAKKHHLDWIKNGGPP